MAVKSMIQSIIGMLGYKIVRLVQIPSELNSDDILVLQDVMRNKLSMAPPARLVATLMACKYVCESGIDGDFVECGVWRGGNSLLAADVFRRYAARKSVYLFDTFAGMTAPTDHDVTSGSVSAKPQFEAGQRTGYNDWCLATEGEVRSTFNDRGLGSSVVFVKGDVAATLGKKSNIPEKISVLRLDTDWYESTKIELEALYPKLTSGGVILIDDYGHWQGQKKAVDEYFAGASRPFFYYTDNAGRIGVKVF